MDEKKPVSLSQQTWLMFIPIIFLWIGLFYRIKSVKRGALPMAAGYGIAIGIQMIFPYPWGLLFAIGLTPIIPVYFCRKWTKEWNDESKIEEYHDVSKSKGDVLVSEYEESIRTQNEKALKILKERLAKGEISKDEYEKLKKEFQS